MTTPPAPKHSAKEKLISILDVVLTDSRINKSFQPVIRNLVMNFIKDVEEDDIIKGMKKLRDEFIPWVLSDEDTSKE